jgi:hypothetical protein
LGLVLPWWILRWASASDIRGAVVQCRYGDVIKHIQIKYDGLRYGLAEPLAFLTLDVSFWPSMHVHVHAVAYAAGGVG